MINPANGVGIVAAKIGEVKAALIIQHKVVGNIARLRIDDDLFVGTVRPDRKYRATSNAPF